MKADYVTGSQPTANLKAAILIYQNTNAYDSGKPLAIATVHSIEGGVVLPGQPVTRQAIQELSDSLLNGEKAWLESGPALDTPLLLPPNLLALSATSMIWHWPSAVRPIFFSTGNDQLDKLSGRKVRHPSLLFQLSTDGFKVFALASSKRPGLDTPIHIAPYFNVYDNGSLCEGSAKMPKRIHPSSIEEAERKFFDSQFSHTNIHGSPLTKHKKGHLGLWQEMTKGKTFPTRHLVPTGKTLAALL